MQSPIHIVWKSDIWATNWRLGNLGLIPEHIPAIHVALDRMVGYAIGQF